MCYSNPRFLRPRSKINVMLKKRPYKFRILQFNSVVHHIKKG